MRESWPNPNTDLDSSFSKSGGFGFDLITFNVVDLYFGTFFSCWYRYWKKCRYADISDTYTGIGPSLKKKDKFLPKDNLWTPSTCSTLSSHSKHRGSWDLTPSLMLLIKKLWETQVFKPSWMMIVIFYVTHYLYLKCCYIFVNYGSCLTQVHAYFRNIGNMTYFSKVICDIFENLFKNLRVEAWLWSMQVQSCHCYTLTDTSIIKMEVFRKTGDFF